MNQPQGHTTTKIACSLDRFEFFKNEFVELFNEGKLFSIDYTYYFNFREDPILTLSVQQTEIRATSKANTVIIYFR